MDKPGRFLVPILWNLATILVGPHGIAGDHWAFRPVVDVATPDVAHEEWGRTAIDAFILARLEREGLAASPPATRGAWLRRVTFDLIGLPPTVEELDAFESDGEPDAFEKVVDRLLASAHHGERWGRHWLDVARYADNKGYVFFEDKKFPWSYTYRDRVIGSFNSDLPYDRFILEQLAADRLDLGDDRGALAAMGFLTLGGRFMNNLHDVLDDRIDVVTRGLMGLTVTCARCHDHKYDPIPTEDYYSLYGIFRSCDEPTLRPLFEPAPRTDGYREFDVELQKRVRSFDDFITRTREKIAEGARTRVREYLLAVHAKKGQPVTDDFMLLAESGGLNPYLVHRWEAYLRRARRGEDPVWTLWHELLGVADADVESVCRGLLGAGKQTGAAAIDVHPLVRAAFERDVPGSMADVASRYGEALARVETRWQSLLADARARGAPPPGGLDDADEEALRRVFHAPGSPPVIPEYFGWGFLAPLPDRASLGEYRTLRGEIETWSREGEAAPPRAMVLVDSAEVYEPRVFVRGRPNRAGKRVPRRFLGAIAGARREPFVDGSGRLELARAIASPGNPLTARVIVNRIWQHHFGVGIVGTSSDFGLRGEAPSHPGLLDHLASRFVEDGWSIKRLHRRILLSSVSRQSSVASGAVERAERVDPRNRLLWRFPRRRLDFEAQRDSLSAVSGGLERRLGGPPGNLGDGLPTRRAVYAFVDRMDLPSLLRVHDFPDPAATSPGRDRTTIAPQALFLMNSEFVAGCAKRLAAAPGSRPDRSTSERVRGLFRRLFARAPSAEEVGLATSYIESSKAKPGQAWERYVHALLMTNELVFTD